LGKLTNGVSLQAIDQSINGMLSPAAFQLQSVGIEVWIGNAAVVNAEQTENKKGERPRLF